MRTIYLDLDCIRTDHIGCYGYHRDTTPNIDALAHDARLFGGCYTSNSPCEPSRAALFSGRFGINNGVVHNGSGPIRGENDRTAPMWMRHLNANGMHPVGFSNFADRHGTMWYHKGFAEHHLVNLRRGFETADEVNAVVEPWLRDHAEREDTFLHIHYWDPHQPYRAPQMEEWMDMFRDEPLPDWPDAEAVERIHRENYGGTRCAYSLWGDKPHWPEKYPWHPYEVSNEQQFRAIIDGYDGAIRFMDEHIGRLLNILADKGVLDETLIIVSGDHGDNFGERGHYIDHTLASEPIMNRPLIVRMPGVVEPGRSDELIYLLDLCPTVCDLMDMPVPREWDGESFAPALRGEDFSGRDHLVLDHSMATTQRAVRTQEHLFVQTLHPGTHNIPEPWWLFNMADDPHMEHDIAPDRPELVQENMARIAAWRQEQLRRHGRLNDPMESSIEKGPDFFRKVARLAERLREDGRTEQARDLVERINRMHPRANLE